MGTYMYMNNLECIHTFTVLRGCGSQYFRKHLHSNLFFINVLTFDTSHFSLTINLKKQFKSLIVSLNISCSICLLVCFYDPKRHPYNC